MVTMEAILEARRWLKSNGRQFTFVLTAKRLLLSVTVGTVLRSIKHHDSNSDQADLWDYLDEIALHFIPEFQKLAPIIHHVGKLTLADLQARQYYKCQLEFYDEVPRPGPITRMTPKKQNFMDEWDDPKPDPFESPFPQFRPSDVEVVFDDPSTVFDIVPKKVFVNGQSFFWKPSWAQEESKEVVEKYNKIHRSRIPPDQLLISRLYGVVVDSKGMLRGELYHWIDIDQTLTWRTIEQAPKDVREKWALQIQKTVLTLHQMDVVWGDVKAENVVIGTSGDAVVIDFEGGATKGWVDEDKIGTREGDVQGLERLIDYIFNDNCYLRLREKECDCEDYMES
ncbi:uncharacterized protein BDR25DRAFT_341136 [Lindgomyces ingoldianus]|uniref:Uncharacterized protein n=1 Tax=Lindgomyces ingoldianus TaxID=673940 RepID=A0ACB6R3N3_9PLEO|nr:uncharacterized protein BDR25DRAFT_341136 [Lindgomyces ingoldianus]KAF2473898.1 hypothetical protein BDR25DRAFT_341136 [Lindgomyces ingoldianus]